MLTLGGMLMVGGVLCWPGLRARRELALDVLAERSAPGSTGRRPRARRRRSGTRAQTEAMLLELLGGLAAGLSAGLPPADALAGARAALEQRLGQTPELSAWLARLVDSARAGAPIGTGWVAMGEDLGLPVAVQVGRAWSVSEQLGSPLMDAVRATTAAHETSARLDRAFAAQSAGPRATVQVLTLLPVLGLLLMPVLGVEPLEAYPPPVLALAVLPGLALLVVGRIVTARMVRRALRTPRLS